MSSAEDRLSQALGHFVLPSEGQGQDIGSGSLRVSSSGGGVRSQGVSLVGRLLLFRVGYSSLVCVPHPHCPAGVSPVGYLWILRGGQRDRGARSQGVSLVGRLLLFRVGYSTSGCVSHSHCSTGYLCWGACGHRREGRGSEGEGESQVIASLNILVLTIHLRQRE